MPGGHGAVADDGHALAVFALDLAPAPCPARRNGLWWKVGRAKGVVIAFGALGKARQAAQLAQRAHTVASPRQDLVRVGLVAHVPDQRSCGVLKT